MKINVACSAVLNHCFMFSAYTRFRYQVSVYRTVGPLTVQLHRSFVLCKCRGFFCIACYRNQANLGALTDFYFILKHLHS